jgi:hypothetical protein
MFFVLGLVLWSAAAGIAAPTSNATVATAVAHLEYELKISPSFSDDHVDEQNEHSAAHAGGASGCSRSRLQKQKSRAPRLDPR